MTIAFKHPEFLWFLFAIAIPIIIHLFSFRKYKKVYFHNIQFIKNIQIEQNSTKSKLKELLILMSRICFIVFLVLTFSQPFIPQQNATNIKKTNKVAIYIDNSFSTQTESENGVVLEIEKQKAQEIVDAYSTETQFFLFNNETNYTENIAKTKEEMSEAISGLTFYPQTTSLSSIQKKMQTCAKKQECSLQCYIISDGQKNSFDIDHFENDSTLQTNFLTIENQNITNISIDSCYFEKQQHIPGETETMIVSISNQSNDIVANLPVKLFLNDTLKAIANINIKPNASNSVSIEYNTKDVGIIQGRIEIEDYPILYDNTYYFSYYVDSQINILDISEQTAHKSIVAMCNANKHISLTSQQVTTLDYADLSKYSVLILDELKKIPSGLTDGILKLTESGKTIICIPSQESDIESYNQFFTTFSSQRITQVDTTTTKIAQVDHNNGIFKSVFEKEQQNLVYPEIHFYYQIENQSNNNLISLENGKPFITQSSKQKSTFFTFASPLTKVNSFATSPLFIGFYNMLLSSSSNNDLQYTIASPCEIRLPQYNTNEALHIENKMKQIDIIPQTKVDMQSAKIHIHPMQQITQAGNYFLTQNENAICGISYNYNRQESQLDFYSSDEIEDKISQFSTCSNIDSNEDITTTIQTITDGISLWRITLCFAFLFILIEILIIVFGNKFILHI